MGKTYRVAFPIPNKVVEASIRTDGLLEEITQRALPAVASLLASFEI